MTCSIDGCNRKHYARTWCSMHYKRWKSNGDPESLQRPYGTQFSGPQNPGWTTTPSYETAHNRLRRANGPASDRSCLHCNSQAAHWAYDHADPDELTGPAKNGSLVRYSTKAAHYIPLCVSCHKKFDIAERKSA